MLANSADKKIINFAVSKEPLFQLLYLLVFSNLLIINAFSENILIKKFNFSGLERIESETVIAYSGLKLGDNYSNEIGNNVLKKLFKTDLFSDVKIEFNNGTLNISVKENPTINLIKLEGNKKKNDEDLDYEKWNPVD